MRWLILLGSLFSATPMNLACERDEARLEEARALYESGLEDAAEGRWVIAEQAFREAYAASCSTAALFNLSAVLAALGRVVETREVLEQLLAEDLEPDVAAQANARLEEARRLISELLLLGLGAERHSFVLDGQTVEDSGSRPFRIDADPRGHSLMIRRDGFEPYVWNGELSPGSTQRIEVELIPTASPPTGGDDGLLYALLIGAGVVAVGAAVALGVTLGGQGGLEPYYPELRP